MSLYFERNKRWRCRELKSFGVREHLHDRIEIIYIRQGHTTLTVDDNDFVLGPGDISVTFPYQVHSLVDAPEEIEGVILLFLPDFVADSGLPLREKIPNSAKIDDPAVRARIASMMEQLHRDRYLDGDGDVAIRKGICMQIMGEIFRASEFSPTMSANTRIFRSVLDYCDRHYTEDISLDRMHEELFVSKYYISYLFSKKMKIPFTRFINSLRVSDACRYLEDKREKISDIATRVGFSSVRTFNRAFLDIMGMTPGEYRAKKQPQVAKGEPKA